MSESRARGARAIVVIGVGLGSLAACSSANGGGSASGTGGSAGSGGGPATGGSATSSGGMLPAVGNGGGTANGGTVGTGGMMITMNTGGTSAGGTGGAAGASMSGAGGASNGGASASGGSAGAGGTADQCPAAPAMSTPAQVTALSVINKVRVAAGAGCATEVTGAEGSATSHCSYYASNTANMTCIADVHAEVSSCTGFTGASFSDRMKTAGYTGQPSFEVMAFSNDPNKAIAQWLNSIWHRIPIVDPWVTEFGYGGGTKCDTIDFGAGKGMPNTTIVVYPYDGQTGLPSSFDGSREGPMPPAPSTGWPSGSPVTLWGKMLTVTEHVLTVDGQTTPIDHVFLTSADSQFLRDSVMMYANKPLTAATKYHVKITGTSTAGALSKEWSFTTM